MAFRQHCHTYGDKGDASALSPNELFVVIIKAVAVWLLVDGLVYLPFTVAELLLYTQNWPPVSTIAQTLATPAIPIAIGICLFFGTGWFAQLAFSEASDEDANEDAQS